MKFVAAKCPNCGGRIKVDINKKVYHCEYCRNDIILDDGSPLNNVSHPNNEYHLNKEELLKHHKVFRRITIILPLIIFVMMAVSMGYSIVTSFIRINFTNSSIDNQTEIDTNVSVSKYNFMIDAVGVQSKFSMENLVNSVIENLNDYDKDIEVLFNGESYTDISSLVNLITNISSSSVDDYSVINEKDSEGYIKKIIIHSIHSEN